MSFDLAWHPKDYCEKILYPNWVRQSVWVCVGAEVYQCTGIGILMIPYTGRRVQKRGKNVIIPTLSSSSGNLWHLITVPVSTLQYTTRQNRPIYVQVACTPPRTGASHPYETPPIVITPFARPGRGVLHRPPARLIVYTVYVGAYPRQLVVRKERDREKAREKTTIITHYIIHCCALYYILNNNSSRQYELRETSSGTGRWGSAPFIYTMTSRPLCCDGAHKNSYGSLRAQYPARTRWCGFKSLICWTRGSNRHSVTPSLRCGGRGLGDRNTAGSSLKK